MSTQSQERASGPGPATPLTDPAVTVALLDRSVDYRQRAVDEVVLESAGLYRLSRSIQLTPIRAVLTDLDVTAVPGPTPAVVPLSLLPKTPLLDFDVCGPAGASAILMSRVDTANRQVYLLRALADEADVETPPDVVKLLFGLAMFTPGRLDAGIERFPRQGSDSDQLWRSRQLAYALDFAFDRPFDPHRVLSWQQEFSASLRAPGSSPDLDSSSENPVLALLDFPTAELTDTAIETVLGAYAQWRESLRAAETSSATEWLTVFGRRYPALIHTTIDPDEPALLSMSARWPMDITSHVKWPAGRPPSWGFRCALDVPLREARSYHLRLRSADESVDLLGRPTLTGPDGSAIGSASLAGTLSGPDGFALYTTDPDRPERATLTVPLRLSDDVRRSLVFTYGLTGAAALAAVVPWHLDRTGLQVVTFPATFSATILLVRERTSLSARVLRWYKWLLVILVMVLWGFALARVTGHYGSGDPTLSPTPAPSATSPAHPSAGSSSPARSSPAAPRSTNPGTPSSASPSTTPAQTLAPTP